MSENNIKISKAKGRPMLNWVGKKPLDFIKSFPAQFMEGFNPAGKATDVELNTYDALKDNWQNLLFHGDNKEVLGFLLSRGFRGKIDLVYIDPPFDSGANYVRKVELRAITDKLKMEGEKYSIGEQIQYNDIWNQDNYLQFMYERLSIIRELLSPDGFILVHCDYRRNAHLKLILDEIYDSNNFRNEIIVRRGVKNLQAQFDKIKSLSSGNDVIYLYSKNPGSSMPKLEIELKEERKGSWNNHWRGTDRPTMRYPLLGKTPSYGQYRWSKARSYQAVENYEVYLKVKDNYKDIDDYYKLMRKKGKKLDFVRTSEKGNPEHYIPPRKHILANSVWTDIRAYSHKHGFPTEKSEALLERILMWLSKKNDIVLDCFIGSGTTAAVAQKLGMRWIGVDINKGAIQITSKRLQKIILNQYEEYLETKEKGKKEGDIEKRENNYSFNHYKVNDYDLKLLRTEARELAIQHIGIKRIRTDSFFEGTLGENLVKLIDLNHPLTLLDLQLIQDELKKRPDENRNITVICLGKELKVDPWIEDHNIKHPVNKLEVIELRTDPKYGKFLIHQPIEADVQFKRNGTKITIKILNFISPNIIERITDSESLIKVKIHDFRSMIDVVLIDNDYNGKTFNIKYSDMPEKKKDLVIAKYELEIPERETTIAIKIIDMLGEEILITEKISGNLSRVRAMVG